MFHVPSCVSYCCSSITIFAAPRILRQRSNYNPEDILCMSSSGAGGRKLARQAGLHEDASTSSRSLRRPSHHALQEPSALLLPFGVPQQGCLPTWLADRTVAYLRPDCHIESLQLRRRVEYIVAGAYQQVCIWHRTSSDSATAVRSCDRHYSSNINSRLRLQSP